MHEFSKIQMNVAIGFAKTQRKGVDLVYSNNHRGRERRMETIHLLRKLLVALVVLDAIGICHRSYGELDYSKATST